MWIERVGSIQPSAFVRAVINHNLKSIEHQKQVGPHPNASSRSLGDSFSILHVSNSMTQPAGNLPVHLTSTPPPPSPQLYPEQVTFTT